MEFISIALVLGAHLSFTKSDINAALRDFREWQEEQTKLSEQFKEDLFKKCAETTLNVNKLCLHLAALSACVSVLMMGQQWDFYSACSLLSSLVAYLGHAFFARVRITGANVRILSLLSLLVQTLLVVNMWNETDLERFMCSEKFAALNVIFGSLMTLDFKWTLPMHVLSSVLSTYLHWQIVGFETVTPTMVSTAITWNFGLVILIVHMQCTIKASVVSKRETHESSSLMLGFQKVLRGVCDGDVVLQRSSCTIVEDAVCLERLLKSSRKLQHTNFLDLLLDVQSRDAFQKFLGADVSGESLPTGLRVSLQGANGPVSMDLFHAKIPRDGGGSDYSLLAMKEDADESSRAIPDAQETQNPPVPHTEPGAGARSAGSVSHVVEGYDELVQFSLLVSNSTELLDIQEARLTFNRRSLLPTLDSGMPNLRRFIRPTDWHRIETMIRNVTELPPEDKYAQCYFRHPMLFRIPGESRSYLRSHDSFVTLADTAIVPGRPTRFWVCFSCFDESHLRRPRLQDLDQIREEHVETCEEHVEEVQNRP